jgi:hypothetical protein
LHFPSKYHARFIAEEASKSCGNLARGSSTGLHCPRDDFVILGNVGLDARATTPIILPRSLRPLAEAASSNKSLDHNNPLRARASCEGSKPANPRQSSQFDATPRLRAENSSHRRRVTRRFPAKAHFSNLRRFPLINDPPIHRFGYLKPGVLILRARDDLPHSDAVRYVADLSLDRRNSKRRNALRSFARHYALLLCLLYISLPDIVEHGKSGSK